MLKRIKSHWNIFFVLPQYKILLNLNQCKNEKKLKTVRVLGKNNKGLQIRRKRHTNFEDKKTIAKNLLKILQGTSFENILNNHQVYTVSNWI